ncbi:putative outer membrane starch-binding protein [Winogradskyella wandonensis]|uniref:Putative outer membrane starch-binding protein n=1 Tax=Winogradskyella wandonensis TaxID=1442586 RepID=A0A4R1KM00_9FLAO|nr:RagB/SusD family nutrient uptake outer membrane protein [Winogradskyella wandonensis]TCK65270.1 putative outer membrane starch-binding protein [Winogradskyella wandonensis]
MKNNLLIAFLFSITLMGCSDQLERFPIDSLVEETAFQTVEDLQRGLSAVIGNYSPSALVNHNSVFTDNCKLGVNNGGQQLNNLNQILDSQTGGAGLWNNRYGMINDANRLFAAAERITPDASEQADYNNILGQAYAFRALAHWDLLLYFGFDVTNPSAEGVPYIDFVSTTATPARNTVGEVLTGIQDDLTEAKTRLAGATDISFATPDFVDFVRARIALETGDYPTAVSLASSIIASYPLADQSQYFNMFNEDADTTEVIWRYDNVQGFSYNIAGTWIFTGTGGGFVEMSNELFGLLDPSDVRQAVNVDPASLLGAAGANPEILIGKYPPNADTQYINDFKGMRVSEAYLIRAEANARLSQFGPAANDVAAIRSARFGTTVAPLTYSSVANAIEDIIAERRLELAYEGHRYNDIKRVRDVLNVGIERIDADCVDLGSFPCTLPVDSEKWIFPIPQAEINANTNLTQAPGY